MFSQIIIYLRVQVPEFRKVLDVAMERLYEFRNESNRSKNVEYPPALFAVCNLLFDHNITEEEQTQSNKFCVCLWNTNQTTKLCIRMSFS